MQNLILLDWNEVFDNVNQHATTLIKVAVDRGTWHDAIQSSIQSVNDISSLDNYSNWITLWANDLLVSTLLW